jgi:hypothetical protein
MIHKIETIYAFFGMEPWAQRLIKNGYEEDEWTDSKRRVFYKTVKRGNKKFERRIEFILRSGEILYKTTPF